MMAVTGTATRATVERAVAATKTESVFQRGRHLAFAIVGLAHVPVFWVALWVVPLIVTREPEAIALTRLVELCFAAFVGWLAYAVCNTNAEVSVAPRCWRKLGVIFGLWCVGQELLVAWSVWRRPVEYLEHTRSWIEPFTVFGDMHFGWLAVAVLAAAAAEEIVYRALLLTALEGYSSQQRALFLHAVVFELVHAFVYGYGISGVWFVGGYILGYAFQRTRSLAVPTLLHAAHNFLLYVLVWYFSQ
jgi:membrane protease YdiL (CAAX protease family)